MIRRAAWVFLVFVAVMFTSCQRAHRFGPVEKSSKNMDPKEDPDRFLYQRSWIEPRDAVADVPIVFIPDTDPQWKDLKDYWNALPFPTGMPTVHIGVSPIGAFAAMTLTEP